MFFLMIPAIVSILNIKELGAKFKVFSCFNVAVETNYTFHLFCDNYQLQKVLSNSFLFPSSITTKIRVNIVIFVRFK